MAGSSGTCRPAPIPIPTLGVPYTNASNTGAATFGAVPQAWGKVVLSDSFNVIAGELPTLIGDEYAFTYENMNVERGLLWAQEPLVSRGVQANYTMGPFSASVSWNDGYYSNRYNEISGLLSYAFNGGADTLAVAAEGQLGHTFYGNAGSTLFQNNSSIYNLIWTHTSGNWTISPYFQYTNSDLLHTRLRQRRDPGDLCFQRLLEAVGPLRICRLFGSGQHPVWRGQQCLLLHDHADLAVQAVLRPSRTVLCLRQQHDGWRGPGPVRQRHRSVPRPDRNRHPVLI